MGDTLGGRPLGVAGEPEKGPGCPSELQASSAGRAAVQSGLPKSPRPPPGSSEAPLKQRHYPPAGPSEAPLSGCGTVAAARKLSRPGAGQAVRQPRAPAGSLGMTFGGPGPSADSGSVSS